MPDQFFGSRDEAAHELTMRELGEEQYARLARRARERGELTVLPSGRALLRNAIRPVEREVQDWLDRAKAGPGVGHHFRPLVAQLDPPLLAMLATTIVVDGLHRSRPVTALSHAIGKAVEDEVRFRDVRREEPELWADIRRATSRSTPTHRRRVAVFRAGRAGVLGTKWDPQARIGVGTVLLECVRVGTGLFEVVTERPSPKRPVMVAQPAASALEWLAGADEEAARLMPFYMPTLEPPLPWEGVDGGGYHTDVVLRRPIARFRGAQHEELVRDLGVPPVVLQAVNRLQEVPWRVNEDLLETLLEAERRGAGYLPDIQEEEIPDRPLDIATNEDARRRWRRDARVVRDRNVARRSRRISFHRTLRVAERLRGADIWFPHRLDFRGRAYPTPHWLSPQGDDLAKALLSFAQDAPPMDAAAWDHLYVYGARLWGSKGNLEQLRTGGANMARTADFRRAVADPNEGTWWTGAAEPFQFLAWCLEVDRLYQGGPREPARLPVHVDASNNGLQLYALMTGDRDLAAATNAIAAERQPADLYTAIAEDVEAELRRRAYGLERDPTATAWLRALPDGKVPRDLAKRPVMTLPYGVTLWSAQGYVRAWHDGVWPDCSPFANGGPITVGKACRYLADLILSKVGARCRGAVAAMDWLRDVSRACSAAGVLMRWESPSGWPVVQEYRKSKVKRVRALLGGAVHQLRVRQGGAAVDGGRQVQGAPPNFVHSVDAAVMHRAVGRMDCPITSIHDSFGVPAPYVDVLHRALREAIVEFTVERDPLLELRSAVAAYTNTAIPEPPRFGTIGAGEVLAAKYLFQ